MLILISSFNLAYVLKYHKQLLYELLILIELIYIIFYKYKKNKKKL